MLPFCAGQNENLENAHLHTDATKQTGNLHEGVGNGPGWGKWRRG